MKTKLLALMLLVASALSAVDINKEIIGDGTFDAPFVTASQMVAAFTSGIEPAGVWYMGNYATWFPAVNTDAKNFWAAVSATNAVYNHFLAQNTGDELTSGRYEMKLDCKVDPGTPLTPFYLKISGYNAVGIELTSKLIAGSGVTKTTTNGGYSITFTPNGESWRTCTATLDIEVPVAAKARIYFIFPTVTDVNGLNSIYIDNVSLKRVADLPKPQAAVYIRPVGDATSWSHIVPNDTVSVKTVDDFSSVELAYNYYVAKGTYKLSAGTFAPKASNGRQIFINGGFVGNEVPTNAAQTALDLTTRAKSDLDENGIVEAWEFSNASVLDGGSIEGGSINKMIVLENNAVMDGFTMQNYILAGSGPIHIGTVLGTSATVIPATNTPGKLVNCTVRKNQCIAGNGGGVYIAQSKSVVDKCLIEDCLVNGSGNTLGGGVFIFAGNLSNSVVRNNKAAGSGSGVAGGGICVARMTKDTATVVTATAPALASDIVIANCLVYNNTAPYSGGIRLRSTTNKKPVEVINCTFANNVSTSNSNVEFNGGSAVFVNNIIAGGSTGSRIITATGSYYMSNNTFNKAIGGTTVTNGVITLNALPLYPGTAMVQQDNIAEYAFKNPTTNTGANLPSDAAFNQANYNAMRKANFTLVADTSLAVETLGATTLPISFKMNGVATNPLIAISGTIPTTDMRGAARSGNITLGAYQRLATDLPMQPSAVQGVTASKYAAISALGKNITVKVKEPASVKVYNLNGVMLKQQLIEGNKVLSLTVPNGIYLVKVNGKSGQTLQKVIIR